MLNSKQQVLLEKKSDVFDPTETYWKFRHMIEALKYVGLTPDAGCPSMVMPARRGYLLSIIGQASYTVTRQVHSQR
jgi:hypothetical protein